MIIKNIGVTLALLIAFQLSKAQQAIGTNTPDASAALDVTSTNKGVLIPRVALTGTNDITTIATPQTSLLVYNSATVTGVNAVTPGFYYYNGVQWVFIRDANQGIDTTDDFWIDSTYVRGGTTIMQIRDNGNVEIGLSNKIEIINRQISSEGTGLRELFRVPNNKLATSGIFSIASVRGNFVHSSNWSWTSNHQTVGKGMLTKLSGSDYVNNTTGTNIPVYIDVASNGDAIILADWSGAQNIDISILKLSGDSVDLTNTGTLWNSPNAGYIRADSVFTREHAFQTRDGLFSGNVGIGEVNPQSKLVVRGNYDDHLTVGDTNQSGGIRFVRNAGQSSAYIGYEQIQHNLMIKEQSGNGDIYFVQNVTGTGPSLDTTVYFEGVNGSVGIGTTTPERKLEVAGDINVGLNTTPLVPNSYGNRLYFGGNAQNTDNLWMARYNTITDRSFLRMYIGDNTSQDDAFQIGSGAFTTPLMHVNNAGSVGLGTAAPSGRLTINETDEAIHIAQTVFNYNTTTPIGMQLGSWDNGYTNSAGIKFNRWSGGTPHYSAYVGQALDPGTNTYGIDFRADQLTAQGDATSSRMFINSNGNVGIGTTNPSESLDVAGNINVGGNDSSNYISFSGTILDNQGGIPHTYIGERLYAPAEKSELLLFKGNDFENVSGPDRIRLASGNIRFDTYENPSAPIGTFEQIGSNPNIVNRMIIRSNGNVGIGTTNPSERLEVVGNILASGTITPSDKRYKTNISSLTNSLQNVLKLKGVNYEMKKEFSDKGFGTGIQIGVIAQEVEKIYPELVKTNKTTGYKGVDYSKFTPVLIEAIKEQQTIIEKQNKKIDSLAKELAEIKAMLLNGGDK